MRGYKAILFLLAFAASAGAQQWTTYFAYNNVTQIAMTPDRVYALSDGSLYSVDKQSEQLRVYNRLSGLHSTGISCIHYDERSSQLIIGYATGKIDLLSDNGVRYIGDLYDKDMTQKKTIYNVTIHNRIAYLSTHFGVQLFDLREMKMTNSYWLRPKGEETPIQDVLVKGDSIYAFSSDSIYVGCMSDNLVDYRYWTREQRSGRVSPDADKGIHYQDTYDHWYAGHDEGIVRFTPTSRLTYKPEGPLYNIPYHIETEGENVYVVPGGRWDVQYSRLGVVMHYDGQHWTNISSEAINAKTGHAVLDFMNVTIDPKDKEHYFAASYGTGLYEFRSGELQNHYVADGSTPLGSAAAGAEWYYTRLNCAHFDSDGNLWMLNAGSVPNQLVCLDAQGQWHGLPLMIEGSLYELHTPTDLVIDKRNPHYKWFGAARLGTLLCLLDDNGTPFDSSDDRTKGRNTWIDQNGQQFIPDFIFAMCQDHLGRLWLGTEGGIAIIDTIDYFTSDRIYVPEVEENGVRSSLQTQFINALCEDDEGRMWVGTQSLGVYVLSTDGNTVVAHYTTDNSAMPSNTVLSLAIDAAGRVYIGTAEGLVCYDANADPEGLIAQQDREINMGSMQQWKLHYSYVNPQEIVATPQHVYALANGALFSVNRSSEEIEYWNKSTGLNGNSIAHIAYDEASEQLVIGYDDGRIDLLDNDGNVRQMPDIYMKAASMAVTINNITIGTRCVYLAMPFGILSLNPSKAEIIDTYYIGEEAAYVNVRQIVETSDSLYALTNDYLYSASLQDNIVDYNYWHRRLLPEENVSHALAYRDELYILAHDSLYRLRDDTWSLVVPDATAWIHASDGQLLVYQANNAVLRLTEEDKLIALTGNYVVNDGLYSQGEYWLAEENKGLIRLGINGDDMFLPDGPLSNFGYRLYTAHEHIYVAPGGRWSEQFGRQCSMSIYDGSQWSGVPWPDTWYYTGHDIRDVVSYAVDPNDPRHFFAATYGTGVFEFNDLMAVRHYDSSNSTLRKANEEVSDYYFTRTDGALWDEQGNLWVLNATEIGSPVHVRTPNGVWHALNLTSHGQRLTFTTPGEIWVDQRNPQRKWMVDQREQQGVILLDDGGTPTYSGDDRCLKRSSFVDQNGATISPSAIRCLTQDLDNRIWIGTLSGIIVIPSTVDFFTSEVCHRIIIPRNDGTGLGDYLLGNEQINCMTADGGNRMWIGTANSGLYLIEDDTITVAHFTAENSELPSNAIQSIAIMPTTGEVFVGTDNGIASYRSDASAPQEDLSSAYAFPNPVRPNYGGVVSVAGLMENTVVNIVDAGGNLVCKTKSHGGMAVWDGNLPDGRRATSGVYTALCNEPNGKHTVVKILFIP